MIRHWLLVLALGAASALVMAGAATAGSCCSCDVGCATEVVEVVEGPAMGPFYVVDQGPVFTGPGIVSFPTTRTHYQSIGAYPYIGYGHRRHSYHGQVVLWQKDRVAYIDVKPSHRTAAWRGHSHMHRSAPRLPARPPLSPRDK